MAEAGHPSIGDKVRFRLRSRIPREWGVPAGAVGKVFACYKGLGSTQLLLDVDFGADLGFLWSLPASDFRRLATKLRFES